MSSHKDAETSAPLPPPRRLLEADTMRALAHPSRMALWELLTVHGPMTATQAAEHVDDSPSNCSFHLRRLARYGLVEEADDVTSAGRSRPWRVTHVGYTTRSDDPSGDADAGVDIAAEALSDALVDRALDRHRHWQRGQRAVSPTWRAIGGVAQTVWWATAEEAVTLRAEIDGLVDRFRERLVDPATRPAGARPVEFVALIHPFDETAGPAGLGADVRQEEPAGDDT